MNERAFQFGAFQDNAFQTFDYIVLLKTLFESDINTQYKHISCIVNKIDNESEIKSSFVFETDIDIVHEYESDISIQLYLESIMCQKV